MSHVGISGKIRPRELQVQCREVGRVFGMTGEAVRRQNEAEAIARHLDAGTLALAWFVSQEQSLVSVPSSGPHIHG